MTTKDTVKSRIYRTAIGVRKTTQDVKDQVRTRKGPIGRAVGKVEQMAKDVAGGAAYIKSEIGEMTGLAVEQAREAKEKLTKRARLTYACLDKKVRALYECVDSNFFTGGKFDYDKAKATLQDSGKAVRQYGADTYRTLCELVEKGREAAVTDFRKYIPEAGELKGKYAGIGSGILLREHYEACLVFDSRVEETLPRGARYKAQIRADLKTSASTNPEELRAFYAGLISSNDERRKDVPDKLKVLEKYFP